MCHTLSDMVLLTNIPAGQPRMAHSGCLLQDGFDDGCNESVRNQRSLSGQGAGDLNGGDRDQTAGLPYDQKRLEQRDADCYDQIGGKAFIDLKDR